MAKTNLKLKLSVADYHRTKGLLNGDVTIEGIDFDIYGAAPGEACLRPVYEEFDVAEMSLSWYVMARSRGEPVYALPIFPLRMFVQPYIYTSPAAKIENPSDLRGKRVGMDLYRLTVGLWARGILEDKYGVAPNEMHWVTSEEEGAGFELPSNVSLTRRDILPEELLLRGEIDALIAPNVPKSFRAGDPRIKRLFPNCRSVVEEYFAETKFFPITHTVVVREELLEKEPWIVGKLVSAFTESNQRCAKEYEYPKRLSFPTAALLLEEEESVFGKDPWKHGLKDNMAVLETFMRYAAAQGYIPRPLRLDEAFWDEHTRSAHAEGIVSGLIKA